MFRLVISVIIIMAALTEPTHAADIEKKSIKIVATTDVHGNFFPYNFITRQDWEGSMARVSAFVDSLRKTEGDSSVILLDNGDILQGQPTVYYYNYIDTVSPHIADEIYKYMRYDAATIGNHDVETGHAVYDRWKDNAGLPVLGANVIDKSTGKPYLLPYTMIERGGLRVAVLGLLTPAIPAWLPENLWAGLEFEDMAAAAKKWIPEIRKKENPDIVVGLFHSGADASRTTDGMMENAAIYVGENVPGLDVVFFGHDHKRYCGWVHNPDGESTLMLNPANNARAVAVADISITKDAEGRLTERNISGHIYDIARIEPDSAFISHFGQQYDDVERFVSRRIGESTDSMSTRDAYFGPSAFMQLLHDLQMEISGAEISMAAPLSFDAAIAKGPLTVSDMFTLYKYENMLYTMELTGQEIKDYLEYAYGLWTADIDPDDQDAHLMLFASDNPSPTNNRLMNPSYNFDSAYGINYTVDVTKPKGSKVNITGMASGEPFDLSRRYRVAVNSYRGNGGGDLLTKGAGISRSDIPARIVSSTDKDLRYYLLKAVEKRGKITPHVDTNWRFVPAPIAERAAAADRAILFGPESSSEQK
ncbi:MAG: 5'-nucleotidase C-terminal domain-containing protein [Muribaculaceae bacterium]|nr:5'-nucleotidase C-terminal domain-containing protein [Muribaculaceae bacterium]